MESFAYALDAAASWRPKGPLFVDSLFFAKLMLIVAALSIAAALVLVMRRKGGRPQSVASGKVVRHDAEAIAVHWAVTLGFIICVLTAAYLLKWASSPLSLRALYQLHYLGSLLIIFAAFSFGAALMAGCARDILFKRGDLKNSIGEVLVYMDVLGDNGILGLKRLRLPNFIKGPLRAKVSSIGIEKPPEAQKYLASEKIWSFPLWAVIIVVLTATGIIKALRYLYQLPGPVLYWSTLIHDLFTIFSIVMLAAHVVAVVIPSHWPLLMSMFGRALPEDYVKAHHPKWYEEIKGERRA